MSLSATHCSHLKLRVEEPDRIDTRKRHSTGGSGKGQIPCREARVQGAQKGKKLQNRGKSNGLKGKRIPRGTLKGFGSPRQRSSESDRKKTRKEDIKEMHKKPHSLPIQKLSCSSSQGTIRSIHNRVDALTVCTGQHTFHVPAKKKGERPSECACCPPEQLGFEAKARI